MSISKLSFETQRRVDVLFPPEEKQEVSRLLIEHFKEGDGLLVEPEGLAQLPSELVEDALERVRFAALKYSKGKMERLHEAIRIRDSDWRDLLLATGFGEANVHKKWLPIPRSLVTWRSRPLSWQHQAWLLQCEGHEIRVENEWGFAGGSRCHLYIDSTLVDEMEDEGLRLKSVLSGALPKGDGGNVDVRVKISQRFLGITLKCEIWIDGIAHLDQKLR